MSKAKKTVGETEWHPVPGLEGRYWASRSGYIMGKRRTVIRAWKRRDGYLQFSVVSHGKQASLKVHNVIAKTFLGDRPAGHEVNHKDGVRTNNAVENLEYTTRKGNAEHRGVLGRTAKGSMNGRAKMTEDVVREIRASPNTPASELARRFGVNKSTVQHVKNGKTWKHVT